MQNTQKETVKSAWSKDQLFSSKRQDWATPWPLFHEVDKEFEFTLDAAASPHNAKCERFLTKDDDALSQDWTLHAGAGTVWLNPPYGRSIGKWIQKAYQTSLDGNPVVCLTFCRPDTQWWHRYAMKAAEIRLIEGRVSFGENSGPAPAPSCLLIFDESRRVPTFKSQRVPRR